jgi:hypothetical protein
MTDPYKSDLLQTEILQKVSNAKTKKEKNVATDTSSVQNETEQPLRQIEPVIIGAGGFAREVKLEVSKQYGNTLKMYVDDEYEYILPRGCKFEVLKIEPVRISNIRYRTYGELKCLNKHNLFIKHYILKLVKQPSADELKHSLKNMYIESRFDINTNLLKNIRIESNKEKKRNK